MLHTPAPFPHAGSEAFLAPAGEAVRIIRNDPDGMSLIAFKPSAYPRTGPDLRLIASGNKRVPTSDLYVEPLAAMARKARRDRLAKHRPAKIDPVSPARQDRRPDQRLARVRISQVG